MGERFHMAKKIRVGVLFGGRSGEHEVSLRSAASVIEATDKKKYEVVPIGITKQGAWLTGADAEALLAGNYDGSAGSNSPEQVLADLKIDVVFPVLHGTFGEDGTIQGLLELANVGYVGSGVLGSAAGMDKDMMKRLFRDAKLPQVKYVCVLRSEWESAPKKVRKKIEDALRYPLFVKPANLGSSVGISKVHEASELAAAIDEAAKYDRKIVVEQGVGGKRNKAREIECAVLGNDQPKASICGEIVPSKEFYDYDAKYIDEGSKLLIPAKISRAQQKQVQQMAIEAFKACDCAGLSRVDFLMDPATEKFYLNEVNTMPGFTSISMYPKLWGATGVDYPSLIDQLIQLGLERHAERSRNRYSKE